MWPQHQYLTPGEKEEKRKKGNCGKWNRTKTTTAKRGARTREEVDHARERRQREQKGASGRRKLGELLKANDSRRKRCAGKETDSRISKGTEGRQKKRRSGEGASGRGKLGGAFESKRQP